MKGVLITILILVLIGAGYYWWTRDETSPEQVYCTLDAKLCPDGSYVGRVPPTCEFAACPNSNGSASSSVDIQLQGDLNY